VVSDAPVRAEVAQEAGVTVNTPKQSSAV
jgi:hypothetical protein